MLLTSLLATITLLASLPAPAQQASPGGPQSPAAVQPKALGRILVSGYNSDSIHVFSAASGHHQTTIPGVRGAQSIVLGPDGLLYACAEKDDQVVRIDPRDLVVVDVFIADDPLTLEDESGGLDGPTSATFGPDGQLYVASFNSDEILRFDGATGAFIDVFVTANSGTLNGPDAGTTFGPDGDLYVPSFYNNRVLRFHGTSGVSLGTFIGAQPGNLVRPRDVKFHDGQVYVASSNNGRVLRYDSAGTFIDVFATSPQPYSLAFHPGTGDLYVVNLNINAVSRHDGISGALLGRPVTSGEGGLIGATWVFLLQP